MKIIDISMEISERMSVYKNKEEKRPRIVRTRRIDIEGSNESSIMLDSHTGTHVDTPRHMLAKGGGLEAFSLDAFIGTCRVIDATKCAQAITAKDISGWKIKNGERILFKTRNSSTESFDPSFVYVDESAASALAKKKIRLVGIDGLGIERNQPDHQTHESLLGAKIAVLEGLRLGKVKAGNYQLVALPLSIKDADASWCRAVLVSKK